MRKWNAILTAAILVLFLLHGVFGAFQLFGLAPTTLKAVAWTALALVAAHTVIGVKLTADSLCVWRQTGVGYFRQNKLFWARRISGFAVMVLLAFHMTAFGYSNGGAYRLRWFTDFRLATQLLLIVTLALHVLMNVRPMLISFGVRGLKQYVGDILFVLSVLLLFMAAAFVVYYLRWNVW